jgi:thioredoxin-dependent peroxiredoxin
MIEFLEGFFITNMHETRLKAGDKAPVFTGIDENGNEIALKDLKGKKVVLFFYPKDNTLGCTKEACNIRDNFKILKKNGYVILGVSADSGASHKKFKEKYSLPYPLLTDPDHKLIKAYDVWGMKKFMGREYEGLIRTTFVIDEKGIIEKVISKVKTANHAAQILADN